MIEFDSAWAFRALGDCGRNDLCRRIEQLEDAFACRHGRLQDVVLFAEVHDRPEKSQGVLNESYEHTQ